MRILNNFITLVLITVCFTLTTHSIADEKANTNTLVKQVGGYSNISNEHLKSLIKENVLIVDIRREEEWKHTGIIEGSKTITFFDKQGRVSQDFLPKFTAIAKKDQPVILICRSGARTKVASQAIAQQLGYTNVINVTDGIMSWIAEKRPVSQYGK